jgi:hypothetical protein
MLKSSSQRSSGGQDNVMHGRDDDVEDRRRQRGQQQQTDGRLDTQAHGDGDTRPGPEASSQPTATARPTLRPISGLLIFLRHGCTPRRFTRP